MSKEYLEALEIIGKLYLINDEQVKDFDKRNFDIIERALQRLEAIESKQKDVMLNFFIPDVDEFTPKLRKYCLYKIGKRIVKDSLLGLKFRVKPLSLCEQLPPDIKGIRVQARFKYVILEDVLKG